MVYHIFMICLFLVVHLGLGVWSINIIHSYHTFNENERLDDIEMQHKNMYMDIL